MTVLTHPLMERLLFAACLILTVAIHGIHADTMVTGTVFCDQCKDGHRSLFDFPVNGAKVTLYCGDSNGQITISREETTNWFGSYTMRFDGAPELSSCTTRVSGSNEAGKQGSMSCGAGAGPPQNPRLMFRMFDMLMYTVDPLLAQPAQPFQSCLPSSPGGGSSPAPLITPKSPPPLFNLPPALPPMPPRPPFIFAEPSACSFKMWTMPEYKCYWRGVNRDTKVAVAFGIVAARRYGTDITLWHGLQGKGDLYRTLLREGITALLNSYNSLQFSYHPLGVVTHMNLALIGSTRTVMLTAQRFKKANSGAGNVACKFTTCQ